MTLTLHRNGNQMRGKLPYLRPQHQEIISRMRRRTLSIRLSTTKREKNKMTGRRKIMMRSMKHTTTMRTPRPFKMAGVPVGAPLTTILAKRNI